jgi:hypothetical protein
MSGRGRRLGLERLESRDLLAGVSVNANQVVRRIDNQILGTNLTYWDSPLDTAQTTQMIEAAGMKLFRLPGGSNSDEVHFNDPPPWSGAATFGDIAHQIAAVGGNAVVTVDYGSASPQEAAAELAYFDAPVTNTTPIGSGQQWDDASNTWVQVDWKTASYWASLRAAVPLAHDDGLNFLRLGRSAPFGFSYFEIGNEVYGSWETDHHGSGGDTGQPHDPATYVAFAAQFARYARQIDPGVLLGVCGGDQYTWNTWLIPVLQDGVGQHFVPGFISDHNYPEAPGSESDLYLLEQTVSDPANTVADWADRAADYRQILRQNLGAAAAGVQLLATEFNSVYANPGKQSTSLVGGLFVADSLGSILETQYQAALFWDLRDSWQTGNNNSPSLYGWRQGGDYGMLGSDTGPAPSTGPYVPYPTYFAEELVSKMVHPGDSVVRAASNDPDLSVYAVRQAGGHLDLLVINKNATTDLTGDFQIAGFSPGSTARLWQYGKVQDTAQSQTTDGHSALASFTATISHSGSGFSLVFPSYSMTIVDLSPKSAGVQASLADPGASLPGGGPAFPSGADDSGKRLAELEMSLDPGAAR